MLLESDVVDAVCALLESKGYHVQQRLKTTQQGADILAVKGMNLGRELYIEAKGETSSRKGSERYGRPFNSSQIGVHVAQAFYKAAEVLSGTREGVQVRAGIALPDTDRHRARIEKIEPVLNRLGVAVFWVQEGADMEVDSIWEL